VNLKAGTLHPYPVAMPKGLGTHARVHPLPGDMLPPAPSTPPAMRAGSLSLPLPYRRLLRTSTAKGIVLTAPIRNRVQPRTFR
jgi:hypothetical protein